jgi:integrase
LPFRSVWGIIRTVSAIGRRVDVVVDGASGKTASARDLRRAFGTRWSELAVPAVLRKLMRHASIETTL